jgi:hypothetical protein
MEPEFSPLPVQVIALVHPGQAAPGQAQLDGAAPWPALDAVLSTPVARRVLAVDAVGGDWLPTEFAVIGQRAGDLGERMAGALADAYAVTALPMLLIRADTLAVTPDMLAEVARSLLSGEADAAFGPSADGGFWLLGLHRPDRSLVAGIPDAAADADPAAGGSAGRLLLERLAAAGLRVALAPRLELAGTRALRF